MWNKLAVTALVTGCLGDGVEGTPGTLPTDHSPQDQTEITTFEGIKPAVGAKRFHASICELLPTDDSACAHACDPDVLIRYIPEGTCVTFTCTLRDGATYLTGGCN